MSQSQRPWGRHEHPDTVQEVLDAVAHVHDHVLAAIAQLRMEFRIMSGSMQDEIENLTTTVAGNTDVTASANALITGFAARLDAAVAAATAAGATPAQMTAIRALSDNIKANSDGLSSAVVANTPAA